MYKRYTDSNYKWIKNKSTIYWSLMNKNRNGCRIRHLLLQESVQLLGGESKSDSSHPPLLLLLLPFLPFLLPPFNISVGNLSIISTFQLNSPLGRLQRSPRVFCSSDSIDFQPAPFNSTRRIFIPDQPSGSFLYRDFTPHRHLSYSL